MASDFGYIEYLCDQLQGAGTLTYRKMFGEYALYCEGKVVGLVVSNSLFVKPIEATQAMYGDGPRGAPFAGASRTRNLLIGIGQARIACPQLQHAAPQQAGYAFVRPYELELRPAAASAASAAQSVADATDSMAGQVLRVLAAGPLVRLEITLQDTSILPPGEVLEVHLGLQDYAARPLRDADPVLVRPRGGLVFLA